LSDIRQELSGPDKIHSPLYRIWIEGASGDLLASDKTSTDRYRALADVPIPSSAVKKKHHITTITAGGLNYRALAMVVKFPDSARAFNVVIATPCDYAIDEIREFRRFMLILGGIMIVVAGAVSALSVLSAMRPVDALAAKLRKITHQNISDASIDYGPIPADLRPFAESVGTMLDRLGRAFQHHRRFTADAAHELRSPLAVAKSTIQSTLLMPANARNYVEMARSELEDLQRMERLIEQLLLLARLEEEPSAAEDRIELHDLLAEVVSQYKEPPRGISVVLDDDIGQVILCGHRSELLRMMSNLIDNAIQHGPAEATVTVRAERCAQQCVRITVHDQGGNIPPEAIGHLTERFYRADASRTRATGGAGLGLAIAAEIAQRHGGRLEIQSSPQDGTDVTVTLPIC
jgi:signal transduction histidine kinase